MSGRLAVQPATGGRPTVDRRRRSGQVGRAPRLAERHLGQRVAVAVRRPAQGAVRPLAPASIGHRRGAPPTATASAARSGARTTVSAAAAGGAPARRRSSAASVGPRKAASARPRPSSSATMATSTPEASGAPPSAAVAQLAPAGRGDGRVELGRRARCRRAAPPSGGPSRSTTWARRVAQRLLLGREADVHQAAPVPASSGASTRRGASGAAPCPTAAAGWRRRPPHAAAACRWRASRPPAAAARRRPTGRSGSSCTAATGTSPARSSARPNTAQSSDGGVAVEHGLDLGRRHLEPVDLDHLLRAIGEVDPALGLQPADVAGAVPAVGECVGGRLRRAGSRP